MKTSRGGRIARLDVDDPTDLKALTESGLIWKTTYAQRAVDAILRGDILLADCRDMPANIARALRFSLDARLPRG